MSNFSIEKKGYNVSEVDAYVDDLTAKIAHLQSQNAELEQKLATAKRLIRRFSDTENALKQNIADSKRAAAYMISDAKERSATLLDEARESCGEIISDLDMKIGDRMNTLDLMKAEVSAFKEQIFALYSSHIELIDTIASTAESFEYEPDYTPVAEAVDKFEEAGEIDIPAPEFVEYPEESIFTEIEEESAPAEGFVTEALTEETAEEPEEETAFNQLTLDTFADEDDSEDDEEEDGAIFEMSAEEFDAAEEIDLDSVFISAPEEAPAFAPEVEPEDEPEIEIEYIELPEDELPEEEKITEEIFEEAPALFYDTVEDELELEVAVDLELPAEEEIPAEEEATEKKDDVSSYFKFLSDFANSEDITD